ncbi:MAG: GAF domain-containing sensor histidine kinase [Anaerolineae bacterium]|nr:GAF domain-containing sensor histidine kinase [Anaerolineae bacterium]MDW8068233.1 GAF domain-containing sensor histidine kinase [Anaerolineae bacterium]
MATGLVHLILFLILLFRRGKGTGEKLALLYMGLALLWIVALTLANLETIFLPVVTRSGNALIPGLVLALAVGYLLCAAFFLDYPFWPIAATAGYTWTVILIGATVYFLLFPPPLLPLDSIHTASWVAVTLTTVALLALSLFRSRLAFRRNRALYWLVTANALVAGQALTLLPAGPLRMVGPLVHLLGAIALTRGALTFWLPNVKAVLRSAFRFCFLFAATAALLAGVVLAVEYLTTRWAMPPTTLVVLLAVGVALIYLPLYQGLARLVDRLLSGVGFDPAQALRDYSQTISPVLDLEQLARTAVQTVAQVLDIQRGALLVVSETERGGLLLRPVPALGEVPTDPIELEPISPILVRLKEQDDPLFQYEVEHHPVLKEALRREREALEALEMEIYLPIRAEGELVGLLALGPQRTGEPYSSRMVEFLATLAQQTGVALQNARLFVGLQELNERITLLNESLKAAYERLERLDRAKSDFLSLASHELRTPLTQIRGYTDILADLASSDMLTQEQVAHLARNLAQPVRRLERIINTLMDASQLDVGMSFRFAPTNLAGVIRMAIEPWLPALKERNLTLNTSGLESIPMIRADTDRLVQAFSNLISNAIKFTPDGGRITIEAHPLDEEHFEVTVADTGIGINKADQELIFEKFYRVGRIDLHSSGDYKFKGGGPGLGLSIVRGIIEGHGGCIWVESEGYDEERCPGSVFHVVLPYHGHRGPCRWKRPGQGE